jgi:hypothetical protein
MPAKRTTAAASFPLVTKRSRIISFKEAAFDIHDDERHVEYYIALGGMIHAFSSVERALAWVLSTVSGADKALIKSIVYPLRVDTAIAAIKRVIKGKGLHGKRIDELIQTIEQLAKINKTRNEILHLGSDITSEGESLVVSNLAIAFDDSVRRSFKLSREDLSKMQYDLLLMKSIWISYSNFKEKLGRISKGDEVWRRRRKVCPDKDTSRFENTMALYVSRTNKSGG